LKVLFPAKRRRPIKNLKLVYCGNIPLYNNFGDGILNEWLFPRLLPAIELNSSSPDAFLWGIGSILGIFPFYSSVQLPHIIFGTGYQYGNFQHPNLLIPSKLKVYAIRGTHTLNMLGLNTVTAAADPGILLPLFLPRTVFSEKGLIATIHKHDWKGKETEKEWDANTASLELWISKLWRCESVVCDSFHAAVVADAYGIPWKPMRWEYKWQDHFFEFGIFSPPNDFILSDRVILERKQQLLLQARDNLVSDIMNERWFVSH
jgi:succinoglycan biosynthesis protein ExoV